MKFSKIIFFSAISALSIMNARAFDLGALQKLGESLQKNIPKQNASPQNSSPNNGSVTASSEAKNSGALSFCEREDSLFGFKGFQPVSLSGDAEKIVNQYFNIDPALAEIQIRDHLFDIRPEIGVSYPEIMTDGGILSGDAKARGLELVMDPSITILANIIQAGNRQKKGYSAVDIDVYESKLVLALTAIQLEPLLKDKTIIEKLLKESIKPGKYATSNSVHSPMAFAMLGRWNLIRNKNQKLFDSYIVQSTTNKPPAEAGMPNRECKLCFDTIYWAADGGIKNWRFKESVAANKRLGQQMFGNKPPYNPPGWDATVEKLNQEAASLNANTAASFEAAKGQSRSETKGLEAERISREGQNTYGAVPNPALDSAIAVMRVETPKVMDEEKKAALKEALVQRQKLIKKVDKLNAGLSDAMFSGNYSWLDIGEKSKSMLSLQSSVCLVAFAENRAARASDMPLPNPNDVSDDEDAMRE